MEYECDEQIIEVIARLYSGDSTKLFIDGKEICTTEVTNGIRQGCTGSPQLFIMVVNKIIKEITK